ncbi:hypothetical protein TcCL_Unassigned03424 [Trypanosoma cruzi]|nr:hypothetical protein TcCL_Unassigned03424 [Trypanosoma cruzi]
MAVTNRDVLLLRVRPSLVRGEHRQPETWYTGFLHTVILFEDLANCHLLPWLRWFPLPHLHSCPLAIRNFHHMAPPRIVHRLVKPLQFNRCTRLLWVPRFNDGCIQKLFGDAFNSCFYVRSIF